MDHAICPKCRELTNVTDDVLESDPNGTSECPHCGHRFQHYYAEWLDDDVEDENDYEENYER